MRTSIYLKAVVFTFLLLAACGGGRTAEVAIIVKTASPIPPADTLFVAGNLESLGFWGPDGLALDRVDPTTWRATLHVPRETSIEFKITRGTWTTEALNADGTIPENHVAMVRRDTTVHVAISDWKDLSGISIGQITGEVEYLRALEGDGIPPRDVIVWLPPGYEGDVDRRYPVLYTHDGQNVFDPATSYTGFDWEIDEKVDSLSGAGRMDEIIVVGIYNTPMRREEYDDTEAGRAYLDFIVGTLKPLIDSSYRTLPEARHTAVMGSSMGGTISFLAVWYHPDVFSKAACLSPYFPPDLPERVAESDWDTKDLAIYIDNGGDEIDTRLQLGIDNMLPVLRNAGFEKGRNLVWYRAAGAAHNERAWARRIWRPLLFMFGTHSEDVSR